MDREMLDYVLKKEDELYCQIRHKSEARKTFVSKHLHFDDLPDKIETGRGRYIVMKSNPENTFLLQDAPEGLNNYLDLSLRLCSDCRQI